MPTIRVDEEVWGELQKTAEPLVDNPNSVLRRLLGLPDRRGHSRAETTRNGNARADMTRAAPGTISSRTIYRQPILEVLAEMGGQGPASEVLRGVYDTVKHKLTPLDRERLLQSPDLRWRKSAQFQRLNMVKDGLLDSAAPRGIWRLTDAGWRASGGSRPKNA